MYNVLYLYVYINKWFKNGLLIFDYYVSSAICVLSTKSHKKYSLNQHDILFLIRCDDYICTNQIILHFFILRQSTEVHGIFVEYNVAGIWMDECFLSYIIWLTVSFFSADLSYVIDEKGRPARTQSFSSV